MKMPYLISETRTWVQQFVEGEEGEWFFVVQDYDSKGQLRNGHTTYYGPTNSEALVMIAKDQFNTYDIQMKKNLEKLVIGGLKNGN